jgi:hypothetical protein
MKKNITITLRALPFDMAGAYKIEKLTNTLTVSVVGARGSAKKAVGARLMAQEAESLVNRTNGYDVIVLDVKDQR